MNNLTLAELTAAEMVLHRIDRRLTLFFRGNTIADIEIDTTNKKVSFSVEDSHYEKDFYTMPIEVITYDESAAELLVTEHLRQLDHARQLARELERRKDEQIQLRALAKKYPDVVATLT